MIFSLIFESPIGNMLLKERDGKIFEITFAADSNVTFFSSYLLKEAAIQLEEYFKGVRTQFELPVFLEGTPFQVSVWKATMRIPYGETKSYWEIAKDIRREKAYRAVGNALNANKVVLIVPCHRVVSKSGIGGFGAGLWRKRWLLEHERKKTF